MGLLLLRVSVYEREMKAWWPEQGPESSNLEPQHKHKAKRVEWKQSPQTLKAASSDALPPRPHFLKSPNTATKFPNARAYG